MHRATQAYFNTQASTTSPGKVVIMLYDGAISFLERAKIKIDEKNYAEKGILISKAIDVIHELTSSLNAEKGGNLAENLTSLYFYCTTTLLQANMKMDNEKIDIVINILSGLRGAFDEILDKPEAIMAAQQNAMTMRAVAPQNRPVPTGNNVALGSFNSSKVSNLYAKNNHTFAGAASENTAQMKEAAPEDVAANLSNEKKKWEKAPERNLPSDGQNLKEDLKNDLTNENINLESKKIAEPEAGHNENGRPNENSMAAANIIVGDITANNTPNTEVNNNEINDEEKRTDENIKLEKNIGSFGSFRNKSDLYQRLLQK